MLAAVLKAKSRSDRDNLDGLRDEDLSGSRRGLHARCDVDGHPGEVAPLYLAFAGVNAGADFDPKTLHGITHGTGALECTCRRLEAREEAVARGVDLNPLASRDLGPDRRAMLLEKRTPASVAKPLRVRGRAD